MGVEDLAKTAAGIRRAWELAAAAVVGRNMRIMRERVDPELDGLVAPKYGERLQEIYKEMAAAGASTGDFYSQLKERDKKLKKKATG